MNDSANRVVTEQSEIYQKIRRVDMDVEKLQAVNVDREKQYSQMAESFSKVRQIGHQLAKCNALLNQNLESLTELNELLPIEERLDPFVWKTDWIWARSVVCFVVATCDVMYLQKVLFIYICVLRFTTVTVYAE